jgi:N-carbamoylputrescine amidase
MKLAVCEIPSGMVPRDEIWRQFARQVQKLHPDILLLNEMPFGAWLAASGTKDDNALRDSQRLHEDGAACFPDLGVPTILGTYPIFEEGRSVNQAFAWEANSGVVPVHTKQFFPDEAGFYEARWFERGETHFRLADVQGLKVGFLICTEVMFNEWARYYGRQGAQVIAVPRAPGPRSWRRWQTALAMAAIVSGCYVVSSNRCGADRSGLEFGGHGAVFDPQGELVAETSAQQSVVAVEMDIDRIAQAQRSYPCYVADLPA